MFLRLCFAIIVVLSVMILPVGAQDEDNFVGINPNPDLSLIWDQLRTRPDDFGVGCMPVNSPADAVMYNANERFPLASVSKLLILIEYARRLHGGEISPNEMVDVAQMNLYDLPRTNRGAHDDFLESYPPNTRALSLWDVAAIGMIQYSSNAASDYVLERLSPVDWDSLYQSMGVGNTDYPHPLLLIPLIMNNHDMGQPISATVDDLSRSDGEAFVERYVNDPEWRASEVDYWTSRRRSWPSWEVQGEILQQHTATGTVYDFLNVMAAIYGQGGPLTDSTKRLVRESLRWLGYDGIDASYIEYGSKLGLYSGGVLTLVAYGQPRAGNPIVSVIFIRNIPRDDYFDMVEEDTIGILAHWMNLNQCNGLVDTILENI